VTSPDKRARQKERRAAIIAAQNAAARRRRIVQIVLAVVGLGAIIGLALFAGGGIGGDDDKNGTAAGDPSPGERVPASPEPPEPPDSRAGKPACGADKPPKPSGKQYAKPPKMTLEKGVDYGAVIKTSCGDITLDLLEKETPVSVNNFIFLARERFYDGIVWHRVEVDQVIQAGDPEGTGQGGPGYEIPDELPKSEKEYTYGIVGMANAGPNTGGSQFFIVVKDPDPKGGFEPAGYPPAYSIFGKVDPSDKKSVATLTEISTQPVGGMQGSTPTSPIFIESVEITES
jgi:cyclophilin family peptidyl-prolyl cis-trans isomerase